MSSFKRLRALAAASAAALALGGCFQPLYGPSGAPGAGLGASVADRLAAVEVAALKELPGQERAAHYLTQELKYLLDGGAPVAAPKSYVLSLTISQTLQSAIVDTTTGRATAATLVGTVNYTLKAAGADDKTPPLTSGAAVSSASYDRFPQRFATVRAARDAEIRVAREVAEQIKTRLAAHFASRS